MASANGKTVMPPGDADALPIEPPEDMTAEGQDAWRVLLPDLIASQVFRASDVLMIRELCEMLGAAVQFREELRRLQPQLDEVDRKVTTGELEPLDGARLAEYLSGRIKRARTGYLGYMKAAQSLAAEFGVSPVARIRLGIMRLQGSSLLAALGNDDD
jgi:phage terminase small subunit